MSAPWVTADLGNSRLKLRAWLVPSEGAPERVAATDVSGAPASLGERSAAWVGQLERAPRGVLASVAGEAATAAVAEALARVCTSLDVAPDPGLENRTRAPELVGVDRLWAARGALALVGASCLVVDAGTALTVDAVRREADGRGAFLGGAIAPGPGLLARSLAQWAARLPEVEPRPGVPALGADTEGAIRSGVAVGLRGAARELALRIAEEAGLEGAPIVLTGGARGFLTTPDVPFAGEVRVEEDLVHHGLLAHAGAGEGPDAAGARPVAG